MGLDCDEGGVVKTLFVNPACKDLRVTDTDAQVVPIGLYYLAAQLLDAGFEAAILNLAQAEITDPEQAFTTTLQKVKPDIIGFSVTSASRFSAMGLARTAKNLVPRTWIMMGGPGATFMADHIMAACAAVDFIVKGEGEITCLALAKTLTKTKALAQQNAPGVRQIPGLVFRDGPRLKDTGNPPLIQNLDQLAHPSQYFGFQHLAMSRGCPGTCTFCGSPKFWGTRQVRSHSADWFAHEITALAAKGISHFYISDDTFTMDRDRVISLCQKLISADLSITWNAISRVDHVDPELLAWMRKAGCIQISFGVESGSDAIKKHLGKPVPNHLAVQAFRWTAAYGIVPRAYFIYGSPGETDDTINQSIDLLMNLQPLGAVFYMLVLFPGTRLYDRAIKKGWVTADIWHKKMEDLPWFAVDDTLDFSQVKIFGDTLRQAFYTHLSHFATKVSLIDDPSLYRFHADFLSRLAMTFSHGAYAQDDRVQNSDSTARILFEKALAYHPDLRAFLGLGMLLQKSGQFDDALQVLNQGLIHFADSKDLGLCKGICLMNQKKFHAALNCLSPFNQFADVRHYVSICSKELEKNHEQTL